MASKVWPNWSFSRTFFIYDHEIVKKEEDDPKLALVYFYPPSPAVSEDAQCLFSGQVMAMVSFMKTLVNSKPRLYCLKKMKIATVHEGRFTVAMASSFNTPDGIAIRKLQNLHSIFKFYQGSIQRILQEHSEDRDAFVSHISKVMPFFLSFVRYHDDKVRETFQDIPMILLPKKSHLIHLKASHLLQWIKRRPKLLAGCIIYKHRVLCTQLTPPITRYLLAVRSKKQLPAVAVPLSFQLPVGVEILMVYLKDSEHSAFGKSKPSKAEAKSSEREASAQSEVDLKEPRSGDRSGEEGALRTGRGSKKTKQKQEEELIGTLSDVNSAIDLEHCKVENHKEWKSETKNNHDFQLRSAKVMDFPSSKETLSVEHRLEENVKSKDTAEIKSILRTPRKKSNVKGPVRTAEDISEGVTKVADTPRKEGIDTEGDENGGREQNSAENEESKEDVTSELVAGQRNLSLNEEDEKSVTKENISRCSTTSEQILDGINNSVDIEKKEGHPTPVESVTINKNCSEELQSGHMSPIDAVVNALPNGDLVTHSSRRKKVSISALGEPALHDGGGTTEQETDVSSKSEEFVNISTEGGASMQEEYGNRSFTEWPPMGQRLISSASFASSRRTSMFTDDGRSRSETDNSEDVCSLCIQKTTREESQKKMPGMVAVSLYTQFHSEDLMVVFIAENTLRTDEQEIKKIHRTIQSQLADLEKELKISYEVETPDPSRGVCSSVSFDTFEHALSTKFDANIPSDDGKFFHSARLLHNEFSKDTELQKVHLGSATATVIADQDFGNQKFQYFASADCGLSLAKGATTKDHAKTPVKDPWGLL